MRCCISGMNRVCFILLLTAFILTACTDQMLKHAAGIPETATANNKDDITTQREPPEPAVEPLPISTNASLPTPVADAANSENNGSARDLAGEPPGLKDEVCCAAASTAASKTTASGTTAVGKSTAIGVSNTVSGLSYITSAGVATQAASVDMGKLVTADTLVVKVTPDDGAADADSGYHRLDLYKLDIYKVKLGADTPLSVPGSPGELIVWIGSPDVEKRFEIGMATDESTVPAVGETALVTPHAPDFVVKPETSECIRIHPSGSEVRFELMPKESGSFEVGASVKLYESSDCSGAPVPKLVENLMVEVVVNEGKIVEQGLGELMKVAWEKFLEFWGALVALILGLLLFAVRGKFKKWFGFE